MIGGAACSLGTGKRSAVIDEAQAGFTLLELLIATGIAVMVLTSAFMAMRAVLATFTQTTLLNHEEADLDELTAALQRDAANADAVFVPQSSDPLQPSPSLHEVDFVTNEAHDATARWAYRFDHSLQIDMIRGTQTITSPSVSSLRDFNATTLSAPMLTTSANRYYHALGSLPASPVYSYTTGTDGISGNTVVEVSFGTSHLHRTLHLIAGNAPTGFGIELGSRWHAVVWREAHTRRFAFGVGQKSWYNIFAEIMYSYDGWHSTHRWCAYEIYDGLDVGDPLADFRHHDPNEDPSKIFATCRKRTGQSELPPLPVDAPDTRVREGAL